MAETIPKLGRGYGSDCDFRLTAVARDMDAIGIDLSPAMLAKARLKLPTCYAIVNLIQSTCPDVFTQFLAMLHL